MHCPYDSYRLFANHTGASLSQWDPLYFRYSLGIAQLRLLGIRHTPNSKALCVLLQVCGPRPPCLLGPEQENDAWLETQFDNKCSVHLHRPSVSTVNTPAALGCLSPRAVPPPPVTAPDIRLLGVCHQEQLTPQSQPLTSVSDLSIPKCKLFRKPV